MKKLLFVLTILFSAVASFATVSTTEFSVNNEKSFTDWNTLHTASIVKTDISYLRSLGINNIGLLAECEISITLTATVGFISVSGTATAKAPTCKEAARVAAQGAKDALAEAKKAIM